MKFNKNYLIIIAFTVLLCYTAYLHISRPKIAYVELSEVYNGFNLKVEKENELKVLEATQKRILDSLQLQLKLTQRAYNGGNKSDSLVVDYKMGLKNYQIKKDEFELVKQNTIAQFDKQIWNQLNQYIVDYSKDNSYSLVLGTNGTGSLMYSDPAYNITSQLITYVNERYSGK